MMRSGVGLCVLGLLCLHGSAFGQAVLNAEAGVLIFCDDPTVEKAVSSALHKFNERLNTGYMLALFQILSAKKTAGSVYAPCCLKPSPGLPVAHLECSPSEEDHRKWSKHIKQSENGSDSVYSLEFSTRRSSCLAGSGKPWTDCDYLPLELRKPLPCNATVHLTETETDTKQVECLLEDLIVPEKASCLGCPVEIDTQSEDIRVPLLASISKYNLASDSTHLFTLHHVGFATRQVVAGFRFKLRFDMRRTTCSKMEHKDLNENCNPDSDKVEFVNCNATVDVAPWRFEQPEAHVECEQGALPTIMKRRPAGWSPLRILPSPRTTAAPSPTSGPSPSPSKASAKEESSEEDTTASKVPTSPHAGNENPFHCPSKSWKPFEPVGAAVPTKATSPEPPVEGALSDTDLLA